MSGLQETIADALQELAEHAAAPRPMAAAAWRAGRRRRARTAATSAACAAAAVAAIALPLIVFGLGQPQHRGSDVVPPMTLRMPIQLRQVAAITSGPCPPNSGGVPGGRPPSCFHLTSAAVIISRVTSLQVTKPEYGQCPGGPYVLAFTISSQDGRRFAAFTLKLSHQPSPRNQVAIIVGGVVVSHPTVQSEIVSDGQICGLTRDQAAQLLQDLRGS